MNENTANSEWTMAFNSSYIFQSVMDGHLQYPDGVDSTNGIKTNGSAIICLNCNHLEIIPACPSCGGGNFKLGGSNYSDAILVCVDCRNKLATICKKCETPHRIFYQTLLKKKGGCFIVTAVYDSPLADEVIYLSLFRDQILSSYSFGKRFIKLYYKFSPFISQMIKNSDTLKLLTKYLIILPLIFLLKHLGKFCNLKK